MSDKEDKDIIKKSASKWIWISLLLFGALIAAVLLIGCYTLSQFFCRSSSPQKPAPRMTLGVMRPLGPDHVDHYHSKAVDTSGAW